MSYASLVSGVFTMLLLVSRPDHAMMAVQSLLLQVPPCQLQGRKQSLLHRNTHPDLALGSGLVRECNACPLVGVICWRFRNPRYHRRANPLAPQR